MSSISGASSSTSGTLGNAPPVSFPGVSSGIDYNAIIEKYTADTLLQEKPTQALITHLNAQNAAILKISSLIGAVQDSLTALSDPASMSAFGATVANAANGSPAASTSRIAGHTPIAGTYTINAQTVATSTTVINNPSANGAVSLTQPLASAGTAILATNGTAANGKFTINGTTINYDVTAQTLPQIIAAIDSALQASDGGSATLNANGTVTLTGVTSIGSGGDSGNLEQVLKLDTAQILPGTLDPSLALASESLVTQPAANVLNPGAALSAESLTTAAPASGTIQVNGTNVAWTAGSSLNAILAQIQAAVPAVTYSVSNNLVTLNGLSGPLVDISGNLSAALNLTGAPVAGTLTSSTTVVPQQAIVVNGFTVAYNPATDSLNTLLANINAATGGAVSGTVSGNTVSFTGLTGAIADSGGGNLTTALKLGAYSAGTQASTAAITNSSSQLTSSSVIGGIDESSVFSQGNNAGFATAVTTGTFTINGVQFTINTAKDTLSDVITRINASGAGVTASYNTETSSLSLTNKRPGPQSILLGAGADSSNFLAAAGLTTGTTIGGKQASLTYTDAQGAHTVFSATNDFTSAIPGIDLNISTSSPASLPAGSTFYTVAVAPDPKKAEAVIKTFITAYNAVIVQLNKDSAAPTVQSGHNASTNLSSSKQINPGGVLYGNYSISRLRDQLVEMVSGFIPTGSTAYNSLQSVGIVLDTNSTTVGSADADDATDSSARNITVNATSGQLADLDVDKFEAAYAANTTAVQALFTLKPPTAPVAGAAQGFAYQLGTLLANTDGIATFLNHGIVTPGNLANVLLTSLVDGNERQVTSLQKRIDLIDREATQQADQLRAQFSASEAYIARLQALQTQIAAIGH